MDTEDMIRELRRLEEKHKNDFVGTGEVKWSILCADVARRLEELRKKEEQGKWIPCKEKMPKEHVDVLISLDDETEPVIAWYSKTNDRWKNSHTDLLITTKVMAWQYLPEQYKE